MAVDCGCIYIQWTPTTDDGTFGSGEFFPAGIFNGFSYYVFIADGTPYYVYFTVDGGSDFWYISTALPGDAVAYYPVVTPGECPTNVEWISTTLDYTVMMTECDNEFLDCCINSTMVFNQIQLPGEPPAIIEHTFASAAGFFNGKPYWFWCEPANNVGYELFYRPDEHDNCAWYLVETKCNSAFSGSGTGQFVLPGVCGCPIGDFIIGGTPSIWLDEFYTEPCIVICEPIEDRHFRKFDSIRLPEVFEEQERGFKICCDCPMLVLGGGTKSWENDITSAWIKLSAPSDSANFVLKKDGVVSAYAPAIYEFPNEENAFYTTIPWTDVLSEDGIGCYTLSIEYNISGIIGELMWGQYNLKPYSINNALETARVRVKYNLQQEIEGINFTGANVEDCIRFNGFIGDRQPNMEIDNLTYQNRVVKTVVRENLDTFTIMTDPLMECFISPMCNLFLLSENEMWISDYNAHNHSYRINDIPVVVEESPEIDYLDQFQRKAILTCVVGLRTKNRRTHY
jgi:hypothetical protein